MGEAFAHPYVCFIPTMILTSRSWVIFYYVILGGNSTHSASIVACNVAFGSGVTFL